MEITNIFINIGISVVSGAAGCGLFVWLGKRWVGNWFAKDLKKYEQQLELLKMQKSMQYSNVYTNRAKVIKDIFTKISELSFTINHFADTCGCSEDYYGLLDDELESTIKNNIDQTDRLFSDNMIYFSDNTNTMLSKYIKYTQDAFLQYIRKKNDEIQHEVYDRVYYPDENITYQQNTLDELIKSIKQQEITQLSQLLLDEFRILIGVEEK